MYLASVDEMDIGLHECLVPQLDKGWYDVKCCPCFSATG
jgi:hypothetical protein